jgi:hypothetical protein
MLCKFVLTSGEPQVAIVHRNLENWGESNGISKNIYTEKRTLDFYTI